LTISLDLVSLPFLFSAVSLRMKVFARGTVGFYLLQSENFLLPFWFSGGSLQIATLTSAFTLSYQVYPLTPLITTALTTHFWKARYRIMIGITLTIAPAVARLCSI
jgi:hypothetical protein